MYLSRLPPLPNEVFIARHPYSAILTSRSICQPITLDGFVFHLSGANARSFSKHPMMDEEVITPAEEEVTEESAPEEAAPETVEEAPEA